MKPTEKKRRGDEMGIPAEKVWPIWDGELGLWWLNWQVEMWVDWMKPVKGSHGPQRDVGQNWKVKETWAGLTWRHKGKYFQKT